LKNLHIFFNQVKIGLKTYLRFPEAMFWMVGFPILMLVGLGFVLGDSSKSKLKLVWSQTAPVSSVDTSLEQTLKKLGLTLDIVTPEQAEERWKDGKLPALLERQNGHYSLRLNLYLHEQGTQIASVVQQGFLMIQMHALGATNITRIPEVMASPGGHQGGTYAAYLLPGLLGLNLLMLGVFSAGTIDVSLREKGGYKRLATTPLSRYVFLAAQLGTRLILVITSAIILLLVGVLFFGIHNQGSYFSLLLLLMLGTACFISLGYLMASFARNVEIYNGFANIVVLPMMMVSGVYFSLDSAPTWLQRGADILPLTPLIKALRAVFNDGADLVSQAPSLALLVGWMLILFVLAVKRFKWV
jgi:ABC-type multidrug transport system permease subunit